MHRTALITGASRGLGRALLLHLVKRGINTVGTARGKAALDDTIAEARAIGGGAAFGIVADVGERGAATRIAAEAAEKIGDIDLVIHNASTLGPVPLVPLVDVSEAELIHVAHVNFVAPLALVRATLGGMVVRGRGTQVFLSSDAAVSAYPSWGPYGAAKAGVDHAARVLAAELEGTPLRVLSIDPGEMDTAMHDMALPGADKATLWSPDDVAARIVRILEDPTSFPSGARVEARLVSENQ